MGVEVGASGLTADSVSQCRGGAGRPSSPYSTPSRLTCDSVVVMRGCTSARYIKFYTLVGWFYTYQRAARPHITTLSHRSREAPVSHPVSRPRMEHGSCVRSPMFDPHQASKLRSNSHRVHETTGNHLCVSWVPVGVTCVQAPLLNTQPASPRRRPCINSQFTRPSLIRTPLPWPARLDIGQLTSGRVRRRDSPNPFWSPRPATLRPAPP